MRPNLTSLLRSRRCRAAAAAATALAAVGLWTATASAHVTIVNNEQPAGSFAVLNFQVPNESDSANTTKVEISIPDDVTLPFVLPRTMEGWKATVETRKLDTPIKTDDGEVSEVVSKVTFDGGSIPPGEFQLFDLQVGPLPDAAGTTISFPAVQTYDNGDVVRWIDPVVEGQAEPEHPSPVLHLTAANSSEGSSSSSSNDSDGLAIAALVVGGVGVVLGAVALVFGLRRRA